MKTRSEFWSVLEGRRSVRRFKPDPIDHAVIEKMLAAAVRAPNAHNRQSWRFAVLQNHTDIEQLAVGMGKDYREALQHSGMSPQEVEARAEGRKARICGAPLVIILFVDTSDLDSYTDQNRESGEYFMAVQSAALAGGHLLLAAEALSLGGVWMCAPMFVPDRVRQVLNLPDTWMAQGMLLLGHPNEEPPFRERKPLADVVKYV